ncbi:MAG: PmoA family protein [Planctomycetota bacterium]|nr:PmoA family protein [Planctomycetota bacterium]MDA1163026.1 PmoA family protein [Planctomycetota bacterium]
MKCPPRFVRLLLSRGLLALGVGLLATSVTQAAVELKMNPDTKTVAVTVNGRDFSTFNFADAQPKPYMWPVRGSDGTILTRPIITDRTQGDHPHHKGVWVAVDEVGGVKFWAEDGKIANRGVKLTVASGNPARMQVINDWLDPEGKAVVRETTEISIRENGLLSYDIVFTASGDEPVEFGDTKEGLFGFRMAESMKEKEGGRVENAEGAKGTAECWGRPTGWIDYSGEVDGKTFGVALFDHPLNFRPSRYHVRDYGLFSISPFGEGAYTNRKRPAQPYLLFPEKELRLRYALFVHDGDTASANVAKAYLKYLESGL